MWSLVGVRGGRVAVVALVLCAVQVAARADDADPPGRAARLSLAEGSVSLQPAGVTDWADATLNRPLTTGDKLWTDQSSRAELDIGAAVIRLGASTGFSFLNLDDNSAQMQVTAGTLIVRVRHLQGGQSYEIDTPNLALWVQQPGEYRVEVNEAGDDTVVKVSEGAAQASGGGQTIAIAAQQAASFAGTNTLTYQSATLGAPDDLDSWSAARERQVEDSPSRQYVADDVAGTQELDNNGTWQNTPDYGYVWMPTAVAVGWVPYRFGHWVWIAPWGWTWVDDASWGYAPFHYGRWIQSDNVWFWVPGPRRGHPVYAPALVGWVGGPALGTPVAFGAHVGWFPLGPREVYVPAAQVSQSYVRNINITNTTIVSNTYITKVYEHNLTPLHYMNNTAGAVTTVPQNVFTSGQRVGGHALRLPAAALQEAVVTAAAPAIAPSRQSVLGPGLGRGAVHPPAQLLNRPVVARRLPPRAPAPLERQIAAIQENGGRPLARAELARLQPATSAASVRVVAVGAAQAALPNHPASRAPQPPVRSAPALIPNGSGSGLAERERALQSTRVTGASRASSYAPPPAVRDDIQTPPQASRAAAPEPGGRNDRPPSAEQHLPSTQQRAFTPDVPARTYTGPPSTPVYHQPAASPPPSGTATSAALSRPPPVIQAPPRPAPAPRAKEAEPRGPGPHADRESRDRGQR